MTFPFDIPDQPYYRGRIDDRKVAVRRGDVSHTVWALQAALNFHGYALVVDGHLGPKTDRAIEVWQQGVRLTVDKIAGPATQRSIVSTAIPVVAHTYRVDPDAVKKQVFHESGGMVGNHTARYPEPERERYRNFDAGLAQCNGRYHSVEAAFTMNYALTSLCGFVRQRFDSYTKPDAQRASSLKDRGLPTPSRDDCWRLAHGSWNRPAWAAWLAGNSTTDPVAPAGRPTAEQIAELERYISLAVGGVAFDV